MNEEREYRKELAAEFRAAILAAQHQSERIEAGWELGRKPAKYQRDIVDMIYDDGLTPKEALEAERQAREPKRVPPLVGDWLRSAWRASARLTQGELEREM